VHRPRRGRAVLTASSGGGAPLPQAWVPRVVFSAIAVVLALCLSPIVAHFGGKPVWVQVLVVVLCTPVVLVILACLSAAIRPGSLGRLARRLRRR
jgi:glycerol-3-phosphate acyltransferase PlsY